MTEIFTTLDQYVAAPRLGGLALSPDGGRLVTTVSTLNTKKDGYVTALWELDPQGEKPARRLTRSAKGEAGPAFAANGDLYFTSARPDDEGSEDGNALWCLPAAGGEAYVVNRRAGGVSSVSCAAKADVVAVVASRLPGASTEEEHETLHQARKDSAVQAILHDAYPVRFWDHDLGPARSSLFVLGHENADDDATSLEPARRVLRQITEDLGARFGGDVHIGPDGTFALFALRVPEANADQRYTVARADLVNGGWEPLFDDAEHNYTPSIVSPDGRYAIIGVSNRPTPQQSMRPVLHLLHLDSRQLSPLTQDADLWLTPAAWLPDGSGFLALADQDGRGPVFRVDVQYGETVTGRTVQITEEDSTYSDLRLAPDGKTAFGVRASYEFPAEVARIDLATGQTQRLLNPTERPVLPGSLTEVETQAEDGVRVRGWLALPSGAGPEVPAPLLLWIHGGPLNSWNAWSWRWNPWLAVQRGYAVLLPDPALSTGYGQDFIQRGWNSWGDKPYTDLMSITDAVVAREDIDQNRTAAMGGSFGGYMANWVAGHTDRFKAIVTHASLWALDQFGPTTDMSPFWRRQINAEMEAEHSPHWHVENIVTPMLVIHGDKDYRVPIGEGLRLWYELLEKSGLPMEADGSTVHRFLYFPDENHWILKPQHAKIWYEVVFNFLTEHVLGESSDSLPVELGLTTPPAKDAASAENTSASTEG